MVSCAEDFLFSFICKKDRQPFPDGDPYSHIHYSFSTGVTIYSISTSAFSECQISFLYGIS